MGESRKPRDEFGVVDVLEDQCEELGEGEWNAIRDRLCHADEMRPNFSCLSPTTPKDGG